MTWQPTVSASWRLSVTGSGVCKQSESLWSSSLREMLVWPGHAPESAAGFHGHAHLPSALLFWGVAGKMTWDAQAGKLGEP